MRSGAIAIFATLTPIQSGNQNGHKTNPNELCWFQGYKFITPSKGLRSRLPVGSTISEFLFGPPEVGVPRLAPGYTGAVSKPRYMLVHVTYKGAKPALTCVAPGHEGKGLHPSASPVAAPFPKRKSRSIPSIRAMSWQCSLSPWPKIEHNSLNSWPFCVVFSGIDRV